MTSYSVADADSDVECMLRDYQLNFIMDNWMNVDSFQSTILGCTNTTMRDLPTICREVSYHNDNIKYLKFISAALVSSKISVDKKPSSMIKSAPFGEPLNQLEFLERLPFTISVAEIVKSNDVLRVICESEITLKQLQKDIERDQLVIVGKRVVGSSDSLENCVSTIGDAIDRCLGCCLLPALGPALRDRVSYAVLTSACRTNSGGVALHTLRTITDTEQVVLFPHSTEAGSLLVKVSVGRFCRQPDGTTFALPDDEDADHIDSHCLFWGLRGEVQASTVYDLASVSEALDPELDQSRGCRHTVEVVYDNCVCVVLDSRGGVVEEGEVWGGGGSGRVEAPSGRVSFRRFVSLSA